MTTIVCDRRCMAADSYVTDLYTVATSTKIRRLADGSVVGAAGTAHCAAAVMRWLAGDLPELLQTWTESMQVLQLTPDGRILIYDHSTIPYELDDDFAAIGSGAAAALAAMHMGADPRKAVKIAAKIDPYTGGRIRVLRPSQSSK